MCPVKKTWEDTRGTAHANGMIARKVIWEHNCSWSSEKNGAYVYENVSVCAHCWSNRVASPPFILCSCRCVEQKGVCCGRVGRETHQDSKSQNMCVSEVGPFVLTYYLRMGAVGNSNSEFLSKHTDSRESEVCDLLVRTGPLLRAECWHDIWDIGCGTLLFFYNAWNLRGFLCSGSLRGCLSSFCTVDRASMIFPFRRPTWVWLEGCHRVGMFGSRL